MDIACYVCPSSALTVPEDPAAAASILGLLKIKLKRYWPVGQSELG